MSGETESFQQEKGGCLSFNGLKIEDGRLDMYEQAKQSRQSRQSRQIDTAESQQ